MLCCDIDGHGYMVRPHPFCAQTVGQLLALLLATATAPAPAVSLVMAPRWGSMLIVYTFLAALLDAHTHSLTRAHMPAHTHEPSYSRRSRQIDRQTTGSGSWQLVAKLAWLVLDPSPGQFNLVSLKSHFLCRQSKRGKFLFAQKKKNMGKAIGI